MASDDFPAYSETVDVVVPLDNVWAIVALIFFGCIMGFVGGLGFSHHGNLEPAEIVGAVTIVSDGRPVYFRNISVNNNDCSTSAITIK